jgi:hypothetical protein
MPGWSVSASSVPVAALTAALLLTPSAAKHRGPNKGIGRFASFRASSYRHHHDEIHAEEFVAYEILSHADKKEIGGEHRQSALPDILGKRGRLKATSTLIFVCQTSVFGIIARCRAATTFTSDWKGSARPPS